ncbi:MAG TPA: nuclear transport factor 2 family protein, partial [Solirubrobacteraceae bacterium]|nr:nuclear transport factor 2 family protein [Solirubrobacteraceae bacterium]
MSEENVEIAKDVYGAFARGDVPAVLGAFADDIEWYEAEGMPYGGLHHGGEAVAQKVFGPITEDVDGFVVVPEEFIASGGSVAVVVRYTG